MRCFRYVYGCSCKSGDIRVNSFVKKISGNTINILLILSNVLGIKKKLKCLFNAFVLMVNVCLVPVTIQTKNIYKMQLQTTTNKKPLQNIP